MSSSGAGKQPLGKRRKSTGDVVNVGRNQRTKLFKIQTCPAVLNSSAIVSSGVHRSNRGFLTGVRAFFVQGGTSSKRLQIWKEKLVLFGGSVVDSLGRESSEPTHVLATDQLAFSTFVAAESWLSSRKLWFVQFVWIQDCLKDGKLLSCEPYLLSAVSLPASIIVDAGAETREATQQPTTEKVAEAVHDEVQPAVERAVAMVGLEDLMKKPVDAAWEDDDTDEDDIIGSTNVHDQSNLPREGGMYEHVDLNADITGPLRDMWHIYEEVFGDEWRALTYKKAGNVLAKIPYKLKNVQQLKDLRGLGKSVLAKVKEIITTGRLKKLENFLADEQVQAIRSFSSVWGIGPNLARRLYQAGCRTLQDVEKDSSLTQMSKLGLKYHGDLMLRIPRDEVAEAEKLVVMVAEGLCPGVCTRVTGSYRRGQPTCGDIDVLITHPDGQSQEGLLAKLVDKLTNIGFLTAGLGFHDHSTEGTQHQADSFMGICKLVHHPYHRRIDMKAYPNNMYAFALLYFTGNDVLNRRLRYTARLKGYKLNDCGLYLRPSKQKAGASTNVSIHCETEQDIFEKLGYPYPEPHERNW